MAKWQPPIPAGALYSKAARALGPALPLLAYCYDIVQRDGWLDLNLKDATGDMDEPYPTIKRWWQMLTDGPFFAEVQNHGRKGMRVKFKDVWIEWRILKAREPIPETFGTETGSEMIPNVEPEANRETIGIIIGTETGSEMIPQKNVYGTHDSDQAVIAARAFSAPASAPLQKPKPKDRTPEQRAYLDRKKSIEDAYVAELGYTPAAFGKEAKSSKWLAEQGYTPEQVVKCYRHLQADEFYARQHISLATISKQIGAFVRARNGTNGHTRGDLPLITAAPKRELTPDEKAAQAKRRQAIIEESRSAGK